MILKRGLKNGERIKMSELIKQYTYNTIPFASRLWRYYHSPLARGLWLSRVRKKDGVISWLQSVWGHAIVPQFFPFLIPLTRREFKHTLKDGGFWRRLYLYMMNYQCDWIGCEMCRGKYEDWRSYDDE